MTAVKTNYSRSTKSSSKFENTLHYLKNLQKSVGKDAVFLIGYEAGPTGYGLCRKLQKEGFACVIIAPSTIAKAPGQKVKTDRMDAGSHGLAQDGELR